MLTIYTYAHCDTCRKAIKFLKSQHIDFEEVPIRDTPPSLAELKKALHSLEGNLRRLFNTSGRDYKALGLSTKIQTLPEEDALRLLASNGNLIRRPFAIAQSRVLIGFDEPSWRQALLT